MITSIEEDVLLSVKEVCQILKTSRTTVYFLIRKKKLNAFRIGRDSRKDKYNRVPWRIKYSDLQEFINNGQNGIKNESSKKQEQERAGNESDE